MRLFAILLALFPLTFMTALHASEVRFPASVPISYHGTFPCADCATLDTQINLLPDNQFQVRMTYLGYEEHDFYSIGLWQIKDGKLILNDDGAIVDQYKIQGNELHPLDTQGQPIDSKLDYSLQPQQIFKPMKPRLILQGLFTYYADAARFTPCATGKPMPVMMKGDYLPLEKAYTAARKDPGKPLLVTLDGEISEQPRMEGDGLELALRVLHFIKIDNATACPVADSSGVPSAAPSAEQIEDRTWVLVQLGEQAISPPKEGLGAHFILMSKDQRVAGSGDCNRLMGGYTLQGNTLKFSKMAGTKMFCDGKMAAEQNFLHALDKVARWSINSGLLVLKDSSGRTLIQLRADDSRKP